MSKLSASNSIIRQLQVVFSFSVVLLIVSLFASFYSTQKLISNSKLVNHTNQVLLEAENVISYVKDAETSQRGFLITLDPLFLQLYNGTYEKVTGTYNTLIDLTTDNPTQQKSLEEVRRLYQSKFAQMQKVLDLTRQSRTFARDTVVRHQEMLRGKKIMDDLRLVIDHIKKEENKLLESRLSQQSAYITYTPLLLLLAALISILITFFAYIRIKRDLDSRIAQQQLAEARYAETASRITVMEGITREIAAGNYSARSTDDKDDEIGRISRALNTMTHSLEHTFNDLNNKTWLQTGAVALSDAIRGERDLKKLAANLIDTLVSYVGAPLGTIYIVDSGFHYKLAGSYAALGAPERIAVGEGLVGQVIKSKKMLIVDDLPENYLPVSSSLGAAQPTTLVIVPLLYARQCIGVIEIGLLRKPEPLELEFLQANLEAMAIGINAALDHLRLQNLLEETQAQSEELQTQHSELENLNAELEAQSQKLQASEEELRVQQEELQQTNEELEERSGLLEEKNFEIQRKAEELELSTRYKSEFLANMSHELRTPLNSILLLSRLLSENNEQNLNDEQIEYARVIQSSGNGLLGLIDEILDLSKIEAGKMSLDYQDVSVQEITEDLKSLFTPLANEKKLAFEIKIDKDVPAVFEVDKMRLEQILKNLISNALKFTAKGTVSLHVQRQATNENTLCFVVKDTGIGIPSEKQHLIFEAFQQADGSTKRKYGGTGLGLSISRELVKLLGGEISLSSQVNQGSQFTVLIPVSKAKSGAAYPVISPLSTPIATNQDTDHSQVKSAAKVKPYISPVIPEAIPDDRSTITEQDKVILIVEDDTLFAKSLLDYTRQQGYKGIVAVRGDEGLRLAVAYKPLGILLDIQLPVISGWEVMDQLKADPATRHIPVHIMSSHKLKNESLLKGAIDFIDKPVAYEQMQDVFKKIEYVLNRNSKKVLIVEDNPKHAKALAYFLETFSISSELKSDISEGVEALKKKEVDCVILDMGIPDQKAYEMLEEAKKNPGLENLPIIIFTGKSLSMAEELKIKKYADSIIVKTAHSYQRMLDEVSLFLHLVEESKRKTEPASSKKSGALGEILNNKTVLVADDDVRNIFSLSKALENYKMNVVTALDGKEALQKLQENPAIDVVLLDMMMPQLDGYETARRIRENYKWKNLPVIAVTAKAMTGDREKCIQAGASDYITKPVDIDQLISLLRVWLYERG
ncbi:response regulator [Rhabdobacter roseus]|uniref:histidine kinase n=1 Tax=Rhabdobacter roseus TaxID=1655419 RepID=A0A840TG66_9BACT|nr:response regulator [Rhabdobacter roseus]MBB5281935.1 signal transduction histidine kinase/DNA-binding response OmpR family regulator/CHASE3 domain sensor protein [Rhabdobacter roseus]